MSSSAGVGSKVEVRSGSRIWLNLLLTALGVVLAFGIFLALMELFFFAPWAYPLWGRPVLVGTWVGDFRTPSGTTGAVLFDIRHKAGEVTTARAGRGMDAKVEGEERWCFPRGRRAVYALSGSANANADRIWAEYEYTPTPGTAGVYFSALEGTLSGYRLQLYGTAAVYDGKGFVGVAKNPDVSTATKFVLRPGTEADFLALCQQLK
jgi:hypothetical protein